MMPHAIEIKVCGVTWAWSKDRPKKVVRSRVWP